MKKIILFLSCFIVLSSWAEDLNTANNLSSCDTLRMSPEEACKELKNNTTMLNYLNRAGYQDNQLTTLQKLNYIHNIQTIQNDIKEAFIKCELDSLLDEHGECKNY